MPEVCLFWDFQLMEIHQDENGFHFAEDFNHRHQGPIQHNAFKEWTHEIRRVDSGCHQWRSDQ